MKAKVAHVFLSSTFLDMQIERHVFICEVIPELQKRCKENRLPFFLEVTDLSWGIQKEENQIDRCIQEVDRSQFFVCFLGHRYGWIPPSSEILRELGQKEGWIKPRQPNAFEPISVTETEIWRGALGPIAQGKEVYAFFCLRECSPPNAQWMDDLPDSPNGKLLENLKNDIRDTSKTGVKHKLVLSSYKPEEKNVWVSQLVEDIWKVIQYLYPSITSIENSVSEEMAQENDALDYFLHARTKLVEGRKSWLDELTQFAKTGNGYFLLTGKAGIGKSAVLAKFCMDLKSSPNVLFIRHFVGATTKSTDELEILRKLCYHLDPEQKISELQKAIAEKNYNKLAKIFPGVLAEIAKEKTVVIVLDAINEVNTMYASKELSWLPSNLSEKVKIIISVVSGSPWEATLQNSLFPLIKQEIQGLSDSDCKEIIVKYLARYGKHIDDYSITELLRKREHENPLYLTVALEECRTLGGLDIHLQIPGIIAGFGDTTRDLFQNMFQRLERNYGDELIKKTLIAIAISHGGIQWQELESIIEEKERENLRKLHMEIYPYCLERGYLIDFFNRQITEAVQERYSLVKSDIDPMGANEKIVREALVCFFKKQDNTTSRKLVELPHHLIALKNWPELIEYAFEPNFLKAKLEGRFIRELVADIASILTLTQNEYLKKIIESFVKSLESLKIKAEDSFWAQLRAAIKSQWKIYSGLPELMQHRLESSEDLHVLLFIGDTLDMENLYEKAECIYKRMKAIAKDKSIDFFNLSSIRLSTVLDHQEKNREALTMITELIEREKNQHGRIQRCFLIIITKLMKIFGIETPALYGEYYWWAMYHSGIYFSKIGKDCATQGKIEEACKNYKKAQQIEWKVWNFWKTPEPDYANSSLYQLGRILWEWFIICKKEWLIIKAKECLSKAKSNYGTAPFIFRAAFPRRTLAEIYCWQKQFTLAEQEFFQAIKISRDAANDRYAEEIEKSIIYRRFQEAKNMPKKYEQEFRNLLKPEIEINDALTGRQKYDERNKPFPFSGISVIFNLEHSMKKKMKEAKSHLVEELRKEGLDGIIAWVKDSDHITCFDLVCDSDSEDAVLRDKIKSEAIQFMKGMSIKAKAKARGIEIFTEIEKQSGLSVPRVIFIEVEFDEQNGRELFTDDFRKALNQRLQKVVGYFRKNWDPKFYPHITLGYIIRSIPEDKIYLFLDILKRINIFFQPYDFELTQGELMEFSDMDSYVKIK